MRRMKHFSIKKNPWMPPINPNSFQIWPLLSWKCPNSEPSCLCKLRTFIKKRGGGRHKEITLDDLNINEQVRYWIYSPFLLGNPMTTVESFKAQFALSCRNASPTWFDQGQTKCVHEKRKENHIFIYSQSFYPHQEFNPYLFTQQVFITDPEER